MALYIIGDLHLALGSDKPMDIFPGWEGYLQRLEQNWRGKVSPEDTVVLAGDTSWSLKLENTVDDFAFLQSLPGRKIILKGNHDYWWTTATKMQAFCSRHGYNSIEFLHNNAFAAGSLAICGTRGWMIEVSDAHDEKIIARETGRLRLSLQQAADRYPDKEKIAVLHYPPLSANGLIPQFQDVLQAFGVERCYYGHLHGYSIPYAVQGKQGSVLYRLISADALGFMPELAGE